MAHTFMATVANNDEVLYRDNVSDASIAAAYSPNTTLALSIVGSVSTSYYSSGPGWYYEILIYDHVLSTADRTTLASYIHSAYGV